MIDFDIIDGKLHNIVFTNGCNGNLKAIGSLLEGADPKFAIERLSGICCGFKNTSCGDQLARAIRQAVGEQALLQQGSRRCLSQAQKTKL